MNQRLNPDISYNNTFFLPWDLLPTMDHLIGMKFEMHTLDDMNHLKYKFIHFVAYISQVQLGLALAHLENAIWGTISGAIKHKLIQTP